VDADPLHPHTLGPLGRHQRELVDRQRPRRALGEQQGHAARVSLLDILHDPAVGIVGARVIEHSDVLVRHLGTGTHGQEQGVVLERGALDRVGHLAVRIDPLESLLHPLVIRSAGDLSQRVAPRGGP
jgi:hypothetical protein